MFSEENNTPGLSPHRRLSLALNRECVLARCKRPAPPCMPGWIVNVLWRGHVWLFMGFVSSLCASLDAIPSAADLICYRCHMAAYQNEIFSYFIPHTCVVNKNTARLGFSLVGLVIFRWWGLGRCDMIYFILFYWCCLMLHGRTKELWFNSLSDDW